ncbi:MAG: DUF3426 domain-containing protein, partial [Burkholderiales bacterium]
CQHVFYAYAHLVAAAAPLPSAPAAAPAPLVEYSASVKAVAVRSGMSDRAPAEPAQAPVEDTPRLWEVPAVPAEAPPMVPSTAKPAVAPAPPAEPFAMPATAVRRSGVWAFGCMALALALGAQAAYQYRGELAARFPPMRPWLEQACTALGCTVGLPQQPRSISIEASDMQIADPARPAVITLTATLRNHAATAIGYPALDIVLTNTKDHTLARRIFLPNEYLETGTSARAGFAANAELTVRLTLDTQELGPAGFRLDLLPAPAR